MEKTKRKLVNIVLYSVLCIGILFLLYDPLKNIFVSAGSDSLNSIEPRLLEANENEKHDDQNVSYNFEEVEELDLQTILMANLKKNEIIVIGGISIPSVNLNVPIGKGTSKYTLALTAGTMKKDQKMGEGNYSLAGHHMKRKDLLFSPLYQVELGAVVYLTDFKYIYTYQIDEQRTIEATEVDVINDIGDEKLLTLITCDDNGEKRLMTRARYINKTPIEEATAEMTDSFQLKLTNR